MSSEFHAARVTTAAERERIYRLRYDVFAKEQGKYARTADHAHQRLADEMDALAEHYAVHDQAELVAAMRVTYGTDKAPQSMANNYGLDQFDVVPGHEVAFVGRLCIQPAYRSTTALFQLVRLAFEAARAQGVRVSFINCMPHLVRLYEQLGYRRYRSYYEDPGLGFQIPMVLLLGDLDYLRAIRSPIYLAARKGAPDPDLAAWFNATFPTYRHFVSPAAVGPERFVEILAAKIGAVDIELLHGIETPEREALFASMTHLEIRAGTKVIQRGGLGKDVFLVLNGIAEARMPGPGGGTFLATFGRGDVFGEMSLVSAKPRSADVIAQTPLEVVSFDDGILNKLIKAQPQLAARLLYNLSRILAQRLEVTSSQLAAPLLIPEAA